MLVGPWPKIVRASARTLSRCSVKQDLAEIAFTCLKSRGPCGSSTIGILTTKADKPRLALEYMVNALI